MEEIETLGAFRHTGPTGQRPLRPRERVGTKTLTELIVNWALP